jgi:hypothetical protein
MESDAAMHKPYASVRCFHKGMGQQKEATRGKVCECPKRRPHAEGKGVWSRIPESCPGKTCPSFPHATRPPEAFQIH